MPTLSIFTNVNVQSAAISPLLDLLCGAVARILGQPQEYVMVLVRGGQALCLGGTTEPAAFGELLCIGGLGPEVNVELCGTLSEILKSQLAVPPSRFFVTFHNCKVGDKNAYGPDCFHALHQ